MITWIAVDAADLAPTTEGVPWPWYAAGVAGAIGLVAYLVRLFVLPLQQAQSGKWLPRSTVDLLIKAKDEEVARKDADFKAFREKSSDDIRVARAERDAEIALVRDRHDTYMRLAADNHARELDGVRRDLDDWRTAYHLAAEVGKVQAAQLDELVEGYRLILTLIQALPKVDSSEVNDRAGRGLPGR